jgi:hypothetical protein
MSDDFLTKLVMTKMSNEFVISTIPQQLSQTTKKRKAPQKRYNTS